MTRSTQKRIADILAAIDACHRYRRYFADDDTDVEKMAIDAVLRNIAIIGEAVKHLPAYVTSAHPHIPWAAIVGMRNNLIHQYFGANLEVVNEVIDRDLAPLAAALRPLLRD
ncbi:DUF86 domain-containing protein [uncultured Microbacterium sp.]|uniref:HepT-like ribonuclease domain-containing protein n=1 Tax=uncultured Microbacterium sp. TaxID=191216 RepID=UPI0035CC06B0